MSELLKKRCVVRQDGPMIARGRGVLDVVGAEAKQGRQLRMTIRLGYNPVYVSVMQGLKLAAPSRLSCAAVPVPERSRVRKR